MIFYKGIKTMIYVLVGIAGVLIGVIIGLIIEALKTSVGILIIDETDPNTDVYRIEIDDLDKLANNKRVMLKISNPHK